MINFINIHFCSKLDLVNNDCPNINYLQTELDVKYTEITYFYMQIKI